ncbi:hypothetical protein BVX97_01305 [bacterium E08(2017)]|nr:hypothetical protein BVX97_01305 [bacterium E08(2017)]
MRLSIIVPACNEEHRIGKMLDAYLPLFTKRFGTEVEFIIVVNGTDDKTEEVVLRYMEDFKQVRQIVEPGKIGKGGALMEGFEAAVGDLIGFVDADCATPPEAFERLVDDIGDADIIIASRWLPESEVTVKQTLRRRIASRCFNLIVRILFGIKSSDTQCGAKLMRGEAIKKVLPNLGVTQWAFDVDLLFQMRRLGYRMTETPTKWHDVDGSQLKLGHASIDMLFALIRLRLLHSPFKGLIKLYIPALFPFVSRHPDKTPFRHKDNE